MAITRRQFMITSAMTGSGVLATRKLAWPFGNSPRSIRKFRHCQAGPAGPDHSREQDAGLASTACRYDHSGSR